MSKKPGPVHSELTEEESQWIDEIHHILDLLDDAVDDPSIFRNRAMTVSTVLLALQKGVTTQDEAESLAEFIEEFLCRLKWQRGKYRDLQPDEEYQYLINFQRHVTQASVEKRAVKGRADRLETEFDNWIENGRMSGDEAYEDRTGEDPSEACQENQ